MLKYPAILDSLTRALVNLRFLDARPLEDNWFLDPGITRVTLLSGEEMVVRSVEREGDYWIHLDTPERRDWQFRVSEYHYGELNKTLEDMLQARDE